MLSLFSIEPPFPPGFRYLPGFLSEAEEAYWLEQVRAIPLQPFRFQGYTAHRRVASFGYDYGFEEGALRAGMPIPPVFEPLLNKLAAAAGTPVADLKELLITEYPPGSTINWHRDAPPFGLIAGLSLLGDCTFRLRPFDKAKQGRRSVLSFPLKRRSLYIIDGEARSAWQHSIPAVPATRYSITVRTLRR